MKLFYLLLSLVMLFIHGWAFDVFILTAGDLPSAVYVWLVFLQMSGMIVWSIIAAISIDANFGKKTKE